MTQPLRQGPREGKILPLPHVTEDVVPAWRLARHAVGIMLVLFIAVVVIAVAALSLTTMRVTVDADGILEPASVWSVRSVEGGVIAKVLVHTGDTVRAGQVVARLDSLIVTASVNDLSAQLQTAGVELERLLASMPIDSSRARLAVRAAEARLAQAKTELRQRMADFMITGDVDSIVKLAKARVHVGLDAPAAAVEAAQAELATAETQLSLSRLGEFDVRHKHLEMARLESALTAARQHVRRNAIVAPATGIVLTEEPERLVGAAITPGQTFLELADLGHWRAKLATSERDIHRIHPGDTADVEIPAFARLVDDRIRGRVEAIGWQLASSDGATGNAPGYRVLVGFDSGAVQPLTPAMMRRGYAAHAKIVTQSERALSLLVEYFRDRARGLVR